MGSFTRSFLVLLVLLNPFVLSVYLIELVKGMRFRFSGDRRQATRR